MVLEIDHKTVILFCNVFNDARLNLHIVFLCTGNPKVIPGEQNLPPILAKEKSQLVQPFLYQVNH